MDYERAKQKLMIHGSFIANHNEWSDSFLGLLKPYRQRINDAVLDDIIECLRCVFIHVNGEKTLDAQVAAGVQGILHYGRAWVLDPGSGLRQSGRISSEEVTRMEGWLNVISELYTHMLWIKTDDKYLFGDFLEEQLTRVANLPPKGVV